MPDDRGDASTIRPVDGKALRRTRNRLEASPPPWLHGEVARRMAERLALLRQPPGTGVDWWPAGGGAGALVKSLPAARLVSLDTMGTMGTPPAARPWWDLRRFARHGAERALPRVPPADLPPASQELVWANMLLHLADDPRELFRAWQRSLAVDGVLMFSTLGPGSLAGLRQLYEQAGWGAPMAPFVDMHDLGDMLVEAGFSDPVMDQETIRLTWSKAEDALQELRSLGSNAHPQRHAGLRTPRWRQRLLEGLGRVATRQPGSGIELEFELVFGHAVKGALRVRMEAESHIALDALRPSLHATRKRSPS